MVHGIHSYMLWLTVTMLHSHARCNVGYTLKWFSGYDGIKQRQENDFTVNLIMVGLAPNIRRW